MHDLLEAVVYNIPAPTGDANAPLRALIFDSYFDPYRGVVALVRIVDGSMRKGQRLRLMASGRTSWPRKLARAIPLRSRCPSLASARSATWLRG